MKAMRKAGLLPSCVQITSEEKQQKLAVEAIVNIFGAIKRNDVKAINSLLSKNPDLSVRNSEGMTAMEYACHLGNSAASEMIKRKGTQPGVAHGRGDLGTVV